MPRRSPNLPTRVLRWLFILWALALVGAMAFGGLRLFGWIVSISSNQ